jgi:protoheme IX farnesyltransferase
MNSASRAIAISPSTLSTLLRDYAELTKLRVTSMIVLTAWTGFYFAAFRSGVSSFTWTLFHALIGIGLVSGGTAGFNEVIECDTDAHMRRTATRPLPAKRMGLTHASIVCSALIIGGATYLWLATNALTALLTLATSVFYLGVYTPLKRVSPICTFMGAFSGAMPPILGWTALRGRIDFGAIVLFGILFFWQFPHFYSIAWLYREDYESAAIRMLPVVHSDGRSTAREIMIYSGLLVPISLLPTYIGLAGRIYLVGAFLLSSALFYYALRLALCDLPADSPRSKAPARHLLRATVIYLPLLFLLMMLNVA